MRKKGSAGAVVLVIIALLALGGTAYYVADSGIINFESSNKKEEVKEETKEEKKEEKVENKKEELTTKEAMELYEKKIVDEQRYALVDINEDGKIELITYKEDTASDKVIATYNIYTYDKKEVINIGKISGKIDYNIMYKMDDNTLLVVYGHMGHEVKTSYKIEDNKLVQIDSVSKDIEAGQNYSTGDNIIPFDFTTDKIQFEIYK